MAATKRNAMLIEEARKKIQTTQLINRLQKHVDGEVELTATQVSAANILLKKSVPDLASVQLTGDEDNPVHLVTGAKESLGAKLDRVAGRKPDRDDQS
jgi:hypothetical protein